MSETTVFELADGRELAWREYGERDGAPVVAFHGSPGTGHVYAPVAPAAERAGVRLIAPDRPGYGHSAYDPERSFESWARDVDQLADRIGIDRFALLGTSSGGPNAAGCARFLGARVVACAIVSGPAPPEAGIPTSRLLRTNRVFQRLTRTAPELFARAFQAGLRKSTRAPERTVEFMLRNLPPCDAAVIARPEFRAEMVRDLARPVSPTAARAAVQDVQLELRPWDFRLRDITVPVDVWHGQLDRNVLVENGIYQANEIPGARLHEVPEAGHWLVYTHFAEILDALAARAAR